MRIPLIIALSFSAPLLANCLGPENFAGNPPLHPAVCDGNWSFLTACVFWEANEDGLDFAVKNDVPVRVINPLQSEIQQINQLSNAKYETPHSKWEFGYKVGLEYTSSCDYWDFGILWTAFKNRSKKVVDAQTSIDSLVALWSAFSPAQGGPLFAREVQATWKVNLNILDVPLGRRYWKSRRLSIHPHFGLRYARLAQDLNLEHRGGSWSPRLEPDQMPFTNLVKLDNAFKGIGLRAGLDLGWNIGCGIEFYSNLAASILKGHFKLRHNENNRLSISPHTLINTLSSKERFRVSRAILDYGFGLQWSRHFFQCTYAFTTQIGWEQHIFFDQNQLWRVNRVGAEQQNFPNNTGQNIFSQTRGTLTTGGWTLSFTFEF